MHEIVAFCMVVSIPVIGREERVVWSIEFRDINSSVSTSFEVFSPYLYRVFPARKAGSKGEL